MPYWVQDPNVISQAEGRPAAWSVAFDPPLSLEAVLDIAGGRELTPQQQALVPRLVHVRPSQGDAIPDILSSGEIGPWIVSQRLRAKIEELEPGVHEFIPVTVRRNDETRDHATYHLIVLTQSVNAVVVERTRFQKGYGRKAAGLSGDLLDSAEPDVTLDGTATAGHHLWRGGVLFDPMWMYYFCSDELAHFVMESGLTGWRLTRCSLSGATHGQIVPHAASVTRHSRRDKWAGRESGPYWINADMSGQGVAVRKEFDPPLPQVSLVVRLASGELPRQADWQKLLSWEPAAKRGRTPRDDSDAIPRVLRVKLSASGAEDCTVLPDILGWSNGPWIVSQRVRDKLEELEPRAHGFIPLEVIGDEDARHYGTYHLILLTKSLDAVVVEKTKFHEGYGEEAAKASAYALSLFDPDIHLRAGVIAGHHLWRGSGRLSHRYFCSDAFGKFTIENDMEGWELSKCSVD